MTRSYARSALCLVFALVSSLGSARAAPVALAAAQGEVTFLAIGSPSALKINGKGKGPAGTLTLNGSKLSGALNADLTSLETGLSLRDRHMKEKYLEVGKFPNATLTLDGFEVPAAVLKGEGNATVPFAGTLELHGVKKAVQGTAQLRRSQSVAVECDFPIVLTDYGISIPSFAGITVAKDVTVKVRTETKVP